MVNPDYSVVKIRNASMEMEDMAHLHLDFSIESSEQLRPGGRYSYNVVKPHPNSVTLEVDCGQPMCGMKADRTLIDPRSVDPLTSPSDSPFGDDLDQRIVGGVAAPVGKWPFIAGLTRYALRPLVNLSQRGRLVLNDAKVSQNKFHLRQVTQSVQ